MGGFWLLAIETFRHCLSRLLPSDVNTATEYDGLDTSISSSPGSEHTCMDRDRATETDMLHFSETTSWYVDRNDVTSDPRRSVLPTWLLPSDARN